MIIQQAQPQCVVTSSTGQAFMTPSYPQQPGMITQYSMAPPQQPQSMVQQAPMVALPPGQTDMAYSEQYKTVSPPAYGQWIKMEIVW